MFIDFGAMQWIAIVLNVIFSVILLTLLITFLKRQELPSRLLRWGLFVLIVLLLVRGTAYSVLQYSAFQAGTLKFLPFGQLITYTIRYSALHYFSSFFLGLAIALFLFGIFWVLEKRSHGRLLDADERYLVVFGALAAGWPGAVLYAIGVFVLPLLATPWLLQKSRSPHPNPLLQGEGGSPDHRRRVRLAPFIIISALLAMGLTPLILPHAPWLEVLVCKTCI